MTIKTTIAAIMIMIFSSAYTQAEEVAQPMPIEALKNNVGSKQIEALVEYPNPCFSTWINMSSEKGDKLVLFHMAQESEAVCPQVISRENARFSLEDISEGQYTVVDGYDGAIIGQVLVENDAVSTLAPTSSR